jgi:hypothetical protein
MRKWQSIACFIALFVITGISRSFAVGLGGYVTLGGGVTKQNVSAISKYMMMMYPYQWPVFYPSSYKNLAVGGGLVLDTAVATLDVFNFRLKIGGEQNRLSRESSLKLTRFHLHTIFGLAPVRTKYIRWWLGPLLEGRYSFGDNMGNISDIQYYGGAAGVATGVNVNLGDRFALGFELGFKYGMEWGGQEWGLLYVLKAASASMNKDLRLHGWEVYGAVSAMFRTEGDTNSRIRYSEAKQ